MREGNLEQLTRDDTLHQDWLDKGSVGIEPPKNILSQCIGSQSFVKPTIFAPSFRRGGSDTVGTDSHRDAATGGSEESL